MRLIDADKLIEEVKAELDYCKMQDVVDIIEKQPTVEPYREVVLFDEDSIPHEVVSVVADSSEDQRFSHINIRPIEM